MAREAKKDFQGPFLGFTYNGRHSSELGIVRINTGNRAEMPLSPSFKDSTAEVPGGKGLYYFNTQIQQRQFTINFAFDDLDEEDVRELREWLNPLGQGELIFDEEPYKAYTVKPNTQPKLSYLVFDREITTTDPERGENDPPVIYLPSIVTSSGRVYKGEGAIGLTAYYPYAKAPSKKLSYYDPNTKEGGFGSQDEWKVASDLANAKDFSIGDGVNQITLYNCGNIKTPLNIEFSITKKEGIAAIELEEQGTKIGYVYLNASKMEVNSNYTINSKLELILDKDGNARNDLIIANIFPYLPPQLNCDLTIRMLDSTDENAIISFIDYDYLYL